MIRSGDELEQMNTRESMGYRVGWVNIAVQGGGSTIELAPDLSLGLNNKPVGLHSKNTISFENIGYIVYY